MALTKVSGGILDPGINVAGIVTATGFDGPFVGGSSKNIIAGIVTATGLDLNGSGDISGNLVVHGNLTANGDFTTLNTTLREVELFRVDANSSAAAGIITQRGAGDALAVDFDYGSNVIQRAFTIHKGSTYGELVGIGTDNPSTILHIQDEYTSVYPFNSPVAGFIGALKYPNELVLENATAGVDGSWTGIMFRSGANSSGSAYGIARVSAIQTADNQADLAFSTRSGTFGERIRITGAGLVGIGTTVPTTALDVRGVVTATQGAVVTGIVTATSFTASDSGITGQYLKNQIKWDRNNYNYIDCTNNSGQFAIRMGSSQTAAFSIDTNADTTFPNERKLKFGSNTSHQLHIYHTVSGSSQHIIESNSSSNHLVLKATTIGPRADYFAFRNYANNANAFTVDADDTTKLYFNGTPRLETQTSRVVIRGSSGLGVYGETGANNDGHVTVHPTGNAVYSRIQFYNAAGNSYASVFAHAGQTLFLDSANNGAINYRANGTGDHIFQNNGQQTLKILDSGYVGIGSGTPSALLDVNRGSAATIQLKNTDTVNSMTLYIGASYNSIYSRGANSSTARNFTVHQGNAEVLKIDTLGNIILKDTLAQGNSLVNYIQGTDVNGAGQYYFGMLSTGNQDLYIQQTKNANLRFQTNAVSRWYIDGDPGHLLPGTAGAVNIGSASAGIGSVFLVDNKKISFGDDEDFQIYHSSGNVTLIDSPTNRQVQLKGDGGLLIRAGGNQNIANFVQSGVTLYHSVGNNYTARFVTTSTGITVTGEVAATQDYPQSDPNIDFVFTRAKKLDPRLTYRRTGTASYVDKNGMIKMVGDNVPRFDHDPLTKECKGLLLEPASSNRIHASTSGVPNVPYAIYGTNSNTNSDKCGLSADTLAPDGSKWTEKVSWKGATFSANGYYRIGVINMGTFDAGDYTVSYFVKRGIDGNHNLDTLFAGTSALGSNQYHFSSEQYSPSYASASINWVTNSDVKIEKFQNGWYRISAPLTVSSAFTPLRTGASHYVLNASSHETYYKEHDWYYWGMQIEPGNSVTSFMGTFAGDSTNSTGERLRTQRGADCLFMDGQEFKDFYNVVESSIVMQYSHYGSSTNTGAGTRPFKISAQTGSDTRIDYVSTHNFHPYIAADGSAVVGAGGLDAGTTLFDGQTNKIAIKVKHQDFASTINGGTVATNTSGSWPPENKMDLLTLGALDKDGGGGLKGHIQRFTYYPVGLTNNQLVTLTS